jgi:hypothetical protein
MQGSCRYCTRVSSAPQTANETEATRRFSAGGSWAVQSANDRGGGSIKGNSSEA